jgi:hypothetical protein
MARMKIEVMHQAQQKKGLSLRQKLVTYLPDYARHAARWSGLLNLRNQVGWLARLMERTVGISARRSLPRWDNRHFFNRGTMGVSAAQAMASDRAVVLFTSRPRSCSMPSKSSAPQATTCMWPPKPPRVTGPTRVTCAAAAPIWPTAWSIKPVTKPSNCWLRSSPLPNKAWPSSAWNLRVC